MIEAIVALLGAGAGLLLLRAFDKWSVNRGQQKLEEKVSQNDKDQARLEGQQEQEDKETKRKVDELTKEQNDKPSATNLSDWFNKRK